ncbi:MAG: YeeE/YedE thiosulfate transporter family protein, partial [Deinococcota bacterium]
AGILGQTFLATPEPLQLAQTTQTELRVLGLEVDEGIAPARLFGVAVLQTWQGWLFLLAGGFLIGFGARYAGGCTSGHAISGLAALQLPSLVAVIGFFIGGLIMTHIMLPYIVRALVHG